MYTFSRRPMISLLRGFLLAGLTMLPILLWANEPISPLPTHVEFDQARSELGRKLFFDTSLSVDHSIACVSCHQPAYWGAENKRASTGVFGRAGLINSPTVLNAFFNFRQFWNGRAENLSEQAAGPLHSPVEMGMTTEHLLTRLQNNLEYVELFEKLYPDKKISLDSLSDAIAEYEKTLFTPNALIDQYLRGEATLPPQVKKGYDLFKSMGCATCHNGINIGGNSYQYLGAVVPLPNANSQGDRYEVTGNEFDRMRFKAPSLRNITKTAPYFHDGSISTLEEALSTMAYHNLGQVPTLAETQALLAFLNALTGEFPETFSAP